MQDKYKGLNYCFRNYKENYIYNNSLYIKKLTRSEKKSQDFKKLLKSLQYDSNFDVNVKLIKH